MPEGLDSDFDVGNDFAQSQAAIGRNNRINTTYYQETVAWREFVRRDLEAMEQRTVIALTAIMLLFFLGFIATGLIIRQFDLLNTRIEQIDRRSIDRSPYVPGIPLP